MSAPKPAPREQYHHGDLARELLEVSVAILAETGADAFTLREAARRAGVSHRAVYRHYTDKRALLAAIAEGGYRALAADMEQAVATTHAEPTRTAGDALLAIAEAYLRFALREPARFQVMFGPRLNLDERFPSLEVAIKETVSVLSRELRAVGPDVTSAVRRDAGVSLWAAVHGLSSLVLSRRIRLRDTHIHSYVGTTMTPVIAGILQSLRP